MSENQPIRKPIWELPDMEDFLDYYIDSNGNVWSIKRKKPKILSTSWMKGPGRYRMVCLADRFHKHKTFSVHRLVAMAFMPHDNYKKLTVYHKNGIEYDNRVDNLCWFLTEAEKKRRRKKYGKRVHPLIYEFPITRETLERVGKVAIAANKKGLPVSTTEEFLNRVINTSVDDFIRQYGLHKVMNS